MVSLLAYARDEERKGWEIPLRFALGSRTPPIPLDIIEFSYTDSSVMFAHQLRSLEQIPRLLVVVLEGEAVDTMRISTLTKSARSWSTQLVLLGVEPLDSEAWEPILGHVETLANYYVFGNMPVVGTEQLAEQIVERLDSGWFGRYERVGEEIKSVSRSASSGIDGKNLDRLGGGR